MSLLRTVVLASAFLVACPVTAHHGPESHYLIERSITVAGVVTEFRLINPHARIYFTVTTPSGEVQKWLAEGNAASLLRRRGWTKESIKVGDFIKVTGAPARDGGYKIDWQSIILPDGTELRGGNTVGRERERQIEALEERRRREIENRPH